MEITVFNRLVQAWFGAGLVTFMVLWFVPAPYGRHSRPGWGPTLDPRLGWMAMELPAVAVVAAFFFSSGRTSELAALVFFAMWEIHYVQRAFVFPSLLASGSTPMPISVAALAVVFNLINGCLQGGWLYHLRPPYPENWLRDPRFLAGAALFFAGMAVNWHSDAVLRKLRKRGETGYKQPHGGLFRWVACPNYLGEMVEWTGWAIATWSLAGAAFAFWTAANLIPRTVWHRRWRQEKGSA
jgi:hypothetical protein